MTPGKLTGIQLGIDASDDTIKIVGASRRTVVFEVSDPQASPELAKALADGAACTATLAPTSTIFVPLNTPALPDKKLAKILPSLLDIQIPLPIADCSYAFVKHEGTSIAYAVRKNDLKAQVDALGKSGCNPSRIVPASHVAWLLALAERPPVRADEPRALFIAGKQQTLLVSGHGAVIEKQSVFKSSGSEPLKRLKLAFGGMPENLVCIVAGDEHQLVSSVLEATGSAKVSTPQSPAYFLARAAALYRRDGAAASEANLRTGDLAHPAASQGERRSSRLLMTALAVSSAAILLASFAAVSSARNAEETSRALLRSRLNSVAGYPVTSKGQRALQDARNALPLHLDGAILQHIRNPIPTWIAATTKLCGQYQITLQHLAMDANGLTASGVAQSAEDARQFVDALKSAGIGATLTEAPKATQGGSFTFFVIPTKP